MKRLRLLPYCIVNAIFILISNIYSSELRTSVPIDGTNAFIYDTSNYNFNSNLSITTGSKADSFYLVPQKDVTIYSHNFFPDTWIFGNIGAEIGDPLFNQYTRNDAYANRDHASFLSAVSTFPTIPLTLVYKYRYIDTYSDHYDSLWANYAKMTHRQMTYSNEGLSHEHLAIAKLATNDLTFQTMYNWYGRWGATPYYFSPIFDQGYTIQPDLQYKKNSTIFQSQWKFDNYSRYYDHLNGTEFNAISGQNSIQTDLNSELKGKMQVSFDNSKKPEAAASITVFKADSYFRWSLQGIYYSDNNVGGNLTSAISFRKNVVCSLSVARDHIQQEKPYQFSENNRSVFYTPSIFDQTNLYSSLAYTDTIFFPINASLFFQFCSDPIWESVSFEGDTTMIKQISLRNSAQMVTGLFGSYDIKFKSFRVTLSPNIMFPIDNSQLRFELKKSAKIEFSYSNMKPNPAFLSFAIMYKDRATLTYPVNEDIHDLQKYTSPAFTNIDVNVRLPFVTPLVNSLLRNTAFILNADHIHLFSAQRIREHPLGNLIGPTIYAGFEGDL